MIISPAALAANITTVADKLHCPLPAGFTAALAAGRELPRAADALGSVAELHAAALAALATGADPAADKDVQRYVVYRTLADSGLRQAAEQRAGDDIRRAIADHSDDIIAGWADAIRDDCEVLQAAAAELDLPDLSAADHTALRHRGQLNEWADASSAADRADLALRGCDAIMAALAIDSSKAHRPLLLAPDLSLAAFSDLTARATAWDVARTAAPLRLASVGDYTAAVGRITAEQQALQRQREADREADRRAHRGALPTIGKTISQMIGS